MKMSGIQKLGDYPLRDYSLDSLNEFLKIEGSSGDRLNPLPDIVEPTERLADPRESNYSFSKKETKKLSNEYNPIKKRVQRREAGLPQRTGIDWSQKTSGGRRFDDN